MDFGFLKLGIFLYYLQKGPKFYEKVIIAKQIKITAQNEDISASKRQNFTWKSTGTPYYQAIFSTLYTKRCDLA
jgi:hypothetical protein